MAIIHSTTPDAAQAFADELAGMLPSGARPSIDGLGPAFVMHGRPGAVGVALLQSQAHS